MTSIAFLGLGAMGSRMALRLLAAGCDLTVWNRSPAAMEPLVAAGARSVATPREAAAGAAVVFSMVRDDHASEQVWESPGSGALHALEPGAIAVECSTLTVERVEALATAVQGRGAAFIDAPVAGTRPQAEAGALIFLAGGQPEAIEAVHPLLMSMGHAIHHAGPAGAGMALKLMVNGLLAGQVAMLAEMLAFGARLGIAASDAVRILAELPVTSPAARVAGDGIAHGNFAPMFPIELVEKDFGCIEATGQDHGAHLPLTASLRALYRRAGEAGAGGLHITAVSRLYENDD